jgi:hypothetical protein
MDSIRDLLSSGKPVFTGWTKEGKVYVQVGSKCYEYWIDAAYIPGLKKDMIKSPWKSLNWLKDNCYEWRKL